MDQGLFYRLMSQLREDVDRQDGEAAVRTLEMIRVVAGPEFTDCLIEELLKIGLRRAAGLGIATN